MTSRLADIRIDSSSRSSDQDSAIFKRRRNVANYHAKKKKMQIHASHARRTSRITTRKKKKTARLFGHAFLLLRYVVAEQRTVIRSRTRISCLLRVSIVLIEINYTVTIHLRRISSNASSKSRQVSFAVFAWSAVISRNKECASILCKQHVISSYKQYEARK